MWHKIKNFVWYFVSTSEYLQQIFLQFFVAFDQSINFNGDTNRYFEKKTIKRKIFTHFLASACRNIKHRIPRMILLEIGKENYGTTNIFSFLLNDFLYCNFCLLLCKSWMPLFSSFFMTYFFSKCIFWVSNLLRELLKY